MRYKRFFQPGGTFFFTVVTYTRQVIFFDDTTINILWDAVDYVKNRHPFENYCHTILPDHLHMIWIMPEGDSDYPMRWRLIKSHFTRHWKNGRRLPVSNSRQKKKEQGVWQRRYWEYKIRDEQDLWRHVEYIHYNPVKHQLASSPNDWRHSSFQDFVQRGFYPSDWGCENIKDIDAFSFE
jgi:putative transposase